MASRSPTTRTVAVGLIGLVVVLMGLKAVGLLHREIYPAVIFPGFARIPDGASANADDLRIQKVVFVTDTETYELSAAESFPEPLSSFYLHMLESLHNAESSPSLQAWSQSRLRDHSGVDRCVVGLQLVEVTVSDPADRLVLNDLDFGGCDESAEASP